MKRVKQRTSLGPALLKATGPASSLYEAVALLERLAPGERIAIGVTACQHGAGTSTMAWHLALALSAHRKETVCLVEANMRTPCLAQAFGVRPGGGMKDVLAGEADMVSVLRPTVAPEVSLIVAGAPGAGADTAGLARDPIAGFVVDLRERFKIVVFDTAPLLPYPDTLALAPQLDGLVLVLQAERDRHEVAERALRTVEQAGGRVLGAILNRQPRYIPQWLYRLL